MDIEIVFTSTDYTNYNGGDAYLQIDWESAGNNPDGIFENFATGTFAAENTITNGETSWRVRSN